MKATIESVNLQTREWEGKNGTVVFISGAFADGSGWSVGVKPENKAARLAELEALIGKEGEFELSARDDYNGIKQWSVKAWPGKPAFTPGGGGRREMSPSERSEIRAEVALKAAVALFAPNSPCLDDLRPLLECADIFYEHITKFSTGGAITPAGVGQPSSGTAGGAPASPPLSAPPAMTEGGTTGAVTGEGTASVPPSLPQGTWRGRPCPNCSRETWKDATTPGWAMCANDACRTGLKAEEVAL